MLNDNLDKYIKENLENARLDWDKDSMWDDIESQLPAKKKDRKGLFLLSGLLLLLALSTGSYLLINSNYINDNLNKENQAYEPIITESKEVINSQNPISSETNSNETNKEALIVNAKNEKITSNEETNTKDSKVQIRDIVIAQKEALHRQKKTIVNTFSRESKETISLDNSVVPPIRKVGISQPVLTSQKHNVVVQLESIDNIALGMVEDSGRQVPLIASVYSVIRPHINSNAGLGLGFYSGVGIANRHLESQTNESLLNLREEHESTLEVLHSGLRLRKRISQNLFVDAGIEYQRINEKLDYTESELISTTVRSDSAYVSTSSTNSLQYYSGDVQSTFTRSKRSVRYNAYHSFNMPLHIGYTSAITPGLRIIAYAGPVINLYQDFSGYNINTDTRIVHSDNIKGGSLLNSLDVGFSTDYTLGKGIDLSLGAFYRRSLSAFSIDDNVLQSYDNMNLQVGILYNFF